MCHYHYNPSAQTHYLSYMVVVRRDGVDDIRATVIEHCILDLLEHTERVGSMWKSIGVVAEDEVVHRHTLLAISEERYRAVQKNMHMHLVSLQTETLNKVYKAKQEGQKTGVSTLIEKANVFRHMLAMYRAYANRSSAEYEEFTVRKLISDIL
jgi:hypothetical protein